MNQSSDRFTDRELARRERFGKRLRRLRIKRGLSQQELADKAKLHRTYVSSIERGERNIALISIYRLAEALDVPAGDLL